MQSFSTPSRPLVPVAANVTTVAVLLLATWWSGAQRPLANATQLSEVQAITVPSESPVSRTAGEVAERTGTLAPQQPTTPGAAHGQTALLGTQWPLSPEAKLEAGALQAVGYTPVKATR